MVPARPGEVVNMTTPSTIRIPRGIVDPSADVAYVVGRKGCIFCLSLSTGEVLASTDFASIPVAIDTGMLIGWWYASHRLTEIHLFSAPRQGSAIRPRWEQAVGLPEWVDISSPEPDSFKLKAKVREERIIVTWEAHARYRGGAAPPVEVEKAAMRDARHILEFDRKDGTITAQERIDSTPPPEPTLPKLKPNKKIVPYRSGASWDTQSWRAGRVNACLISTTDASGIVLLHQDDRGAEAEIRLTGDPKAVAAVTLDGSHIFIHEPAGTGSAWQVFSTETGTRVASLGYDPGSEGISVFKERVLYEAREEAKGMRRRTLRCRNLLTGEPMWTFVLDEEAVKPPPPLPR